MHMHIVLEFLLIGWLHKTTSQIKLTKVRCVILRFWRQILDKSFPYKTSSANHSHARNTSEPCTTSYAANVFN